MIDVFGILGITTTTGKFQVETNILLRKNILMHIYILTERCVNCVEKTKTISLYRKEHTKGNFQKYISRCTFITKCFF